MTVSDYSAVSFDDSDTRDDEMHSTIKMWVEDLIDLVDDATRSQEFQNWLDVQSRFHDYSHRNTLLIQLQRPNATRVAGYRTWQTEFDRHVKEGEDAIWIWAPIITTKCPDCGNSPSYHEHSGCEYDETPPEEWAEGLVGFKPTPVFDVSQTDGKPLPDLNTEAVGEAVDLVPAFLKAADELGIEAHVVPADDWSHGDARGVCNYTGSTDSQPVVEAKARENDADLAVTLLHEYAHALLHSDDDSVDERSKREVEAEAVAYIVGRNAGLDTSGSAFYLAAWQVEEPESIMDRLSRISSTAAEIIAAIEE